MTGAGSPEEWGELIWADGVDEDESAALMRAVLETTDMHSFDNSAPPAPQTARRVLTIVCDRPHAHRDSRPELAFVYTTSEGPLYQARAVPGFEPRRDAEAMSDRDGLAPPVDPVRILHVQQHVILLNRTCPDSLPVQCRTHGTSTISASQLRELIVAFSTEGLSVPPSLLVTSFRST